ncbi:MAG TPA: hypothetical protein VML55_16380, partial [Planctomycetaceae bacterium]|nr:hypothetical protein [Planctomycetaceae bacterium]
TVATGCRLHFGLLAGGGTDGPRFGGAGVMLDSPAVELALESADHGSVSGAPPARSRVEQFVALYRDRCPAEHVPRACRIEVRRAIPPHAGLGSGTQLGLAVARGLSALGGESAVPAAELARRVGRGTRSAIGIYGFEHGGFLVDAGKLDRQAIGTLAARLPFPAAWRFVLVTPPDDAGLSGPAERAAFRQLPPMSPAVIAELGRFLSHELQPAVAGVEFERAGEALFQFNRRVGELFAAIQGGVYASPRMAQLAGRLRAEGVRGVGQTSWGPTLFALVASQTAAENLIKRLHDDGSCAGCAIRVSRPKNDPARVVAER